MLGLAFFPFRSKHTWCRELAVLPRNGSKLTTWIVMLAVRFGNMAAHRARLEQGVARLQKEAEEKDWLPLLDDVSGAEA